MISTFVNTIWDVCGWWIEHVWAFGSVPLPGTDFKIGTVLCAVLVFDLGLGLVGGMLGVEFPSPGRVLPPPLRGSAPRLEGHSPRWASGSKQYRLDAHRAHDEK